MPGKAEKFTINLKEPRAEQNSQLVYSEPLIDWLGKNNLSLVFTSYQIGKLFWLGQNLPYSGLHVVRRTFPRCMGLTIDDENIYLGTLFQIWKLTNSLQTGRKHKDYDRIYTPKVCYITGKLDIHDMIVTHEKKIIFANTLFNCLATVSDQYNFEPVWFPPFMTTYIPHDCCHLNGLASENGQAKYVTLFSQTNFLDGWRGNVNEKGVVMDITTNEVICDGLSMPHSPRVYQDKIWLLNSGTGHFGYVDKNTGKFCEIMFLPGYLRGLRFVGDYAIVGMSRLRQKNMLNQTGLEQTLNANNQTALCGLRIINLKTGVIEHEIDFEGALQEIYDVDVLHGIRKPWAVSTVNDDVSRSVSFPNPKSQFGEWDFVTLKKIELKNEQQSPATTTDTN